MQLILTYFGCINTSKVLPTVQDKILSNTEVTFLTQGVQTIHYDSNVITSK